MTAQLTRLELWCTAFARYLVGLVGQPQGQPGLMHQHTSDAVLAADISAGACVHFRAVVLSWVALGPQVRPLLSGAAVLQCLCVVPACTWADHEEVAWAGQHWGHAEVLLGRR